jgi:Domain of unknown function (DUF222)
MGHQPDPNAEPAGDPDPEPPASSGSPASPGSDGSPTSPTSPASPGSPSSPNSSCSSAPLDGPGTPGAEAASGEVPREELLAGFASGGTWDTRLPGADLAAALATAAGNEWRCRGASGEQLIGVLGRLAALESWAAAGKLGVIRALLRDDDPGFLSGSRHGDLPDVWDDSLTSEIALALAASVPSADKTMRSAWELGARLPEISALLENGTIDAPKARLIAETFQDLSDENAGRAEALIVPELTEPPAKTYTQVERIATAIALTVDPHLGERQRKAAEKHAARVQMFRERAGTAALTGRDLPTDQTLAAYANVCARAAQYKESAVFAKARMDQLRAAAYLDLLNAITAEDRIAHGLLTEQTPADDPADDGPQASEDPGTDADADAGRTRAPQPAGGPGPARIPRPGGDDCPCSECDGSCLPDDDSPDDDSPDDDSPDDDSPDDDDPDDGPEGGSPGDGSGADGAEPPCGGPGNGRREPGGDDGGRPGGDSPRAGSAPLPTPSCGPAEPRPVLQDLIVPMATLLGLDDRPGEGHGLGALDPDLSRTLAATTVLSRYTIVCITVTDPGGIAIGHGCAKSGKLVTPPLGGPAPPLVAFPARINLTITADHLAELLSAEPRSQVGPAPPAARGPDGWALAPGGTPVTRATSGPPGDPDWCGAWKLRLPGGREFSVRLEPVPTYACDHRNESHGYHPNDKLRHLVQVRDYTCTFPTCSRHARDSDFEHAVPHDKGGRTCACNAGARSRKCHRVKQSPGWKVTQPRPGWHQWETPRGRTYTQGPKRYPV